MSNKRDPKWEQWGAELRRLREASGRTQTDLGRSALLAKSTISTFERGTRSPRWVHAEALDAALSTGGLLCRVWTEITNQRYIPDWFQDALQIERHAAGIREYESNVIPGLLQTPHYARTLLRDAQPSAEAEEIEKGVRARTGRLSLLEGSPHLWFVLRESAFTEMVGDATVMREQLQHVITLAEEKGLGVQVLPGEAATSLGTCLPFRLFTLSQAQHSAAYVEDAVGGRVVDDPPTVNHLTHLFGRLQAEALPPAESLNLIRKTMEIRYGAVD